MKYYIHTCELIEHPHTFENSITMESSRSVFRELFEIINNNEYVSEVVQYELKNTGLNKIMNSHKMAQPGAVIGPSQIPWSLDFIRDLTSAFLEEGGVPFDLEIPRARLMGGTRKDAAIITHLMDKCPQLVIVSLQKYQPARRYYDLGDRQYRTNDDSHQAFYRDLLKIHPDYVKNWSLEKIL